MSSEAGERLKYLELCPLLHTNFKKDMDELAEKRRKKNSAPFNERQKLRLHAKDDGTIVTHEKSRSKAPCIQLPLPIGRKRKAESAGHNRASSSSSSSSSNSADMSMCMQVPFLLLCALYQKQSAISFTMCIVSNCDIFDFFQSRENMLVHKHVIARGAVLGCLRESVKPGNEDFFVKVGPQLPNPPNPAVTILQ
jgi:hypothetical protein